MKIVLNYDIVNGNVTDNEGNNVGNWPGLSEYELEDKDLEPEPLSPKEIIALKDQGFDAKEIIDMRKAGVL